MPESPVKAFLKLINVYYQEPSADTSDFGHQDQNYKNYIFLLATNLSAQMMSTNDDIIQWQLMD